jgi:hypothetical protein
MRSTGSMRALTVPGVCASEIASSLARCASTSTGIGSVRSSRAQAVSRTPRDAAEGGQEGADVPGRPSGVKGRCWRGCELRLLTSHDSYLLTNDCGTSSWSATCTCVSPASRRELAQEAAELLVLGRVDRLIHLASATEQARVSGNDYHYRVQLRGALS